MKKNYLKNRTVCKNWYNMNGRENKDQQPKIDITIHKKPITQNKFENKTCHRHLKVGGSGHGKSNLMIYIPIKKQRPIFIITKLLDQYPNTKAQISKEIQCLESYGNSTVVFDDILLSKQESNIDLLFTRGRHSNIDIYYIAQNSFHLPKNFIRKSSIIIDFFKQTLRVIILLFHKIAGLDMNLEERKQFCRMAWENDYLYLQTDIFVKIGEGSYTIRNCIGNTYVESITETKSF